MATKNYKYFAQCKDKTVEQQISDIIRRAHQYRNRLCELEHKKRERFYGIIRENSPEYRETEAEISQLSSEIDALRDQIMEERKRQGTVAPAGVQIQRDKIKSHSAKLKELRAKQKKIIAELHGNPEINSAIKAYAEEHKEALKRAKADSGLYWGTEAVVRASTSSFSSGPPPKFLRYDGTGQLGVQFQKGRTADWFFQQNTLCWMQPKDKKHFNCWFRIASDPDTREPVFACITVTLHRPLPPNGMVKWAYLERRKRANRWRYYLRMTIDTPDPPPPEGTSWAAIHVAWTRHDSGLVVAHALGHDNQYKRLSLPEKHVADYDRLDSISSKRSTDFNHALRQLVLWRKHNRSLPEWFYDATKTAHNWRSQARLASLILRWRDERFAGDEIAFHHFDRWRKKDKQLWQHFARLSERVANRRRDLYRCWVKQLRSRYDFVMLGQIQTKKLTKNSQPEDMQHDATAVHRAAKQAATSELVRFIDEAFHLGVVRVDTNNLTRQCANCGTVYKGDTSRHRTWQCKGCGQTIEQEHNALANTAARGEAMVKSGALLELHKQHELAQEKAKHRLEKMQAARWGARKRERDSSTDKDLCD